MIKHLLEFYNITSKDKNKSTIKKYKIKKNFILPINNNYSVLLPNALKNKLNSEYILNTLIENQNRKYYTNIDSYCNNLYSPYDFFTKEAILLLQKSIDSKKHINVNNIFSFILKKPIYISNNTISLKELTNNTLNIARTIFNTPIVSTEILLYTLCILLNIKKDNKYLYILLKKIYNYENILKAYSNLNILHINYLIYKEFSQKQWEDLIKKEDLYSIFSNISLYVITQIQYKTLKIEKLLSYNLLKKYL